MTNLARLARAGLTHTRCLRSREMVSALPDMWLVLAPLPSMSTELGATFGTRRTFFALAARLRQELTEVTTGEPDVPDDIRRALLTLPEANRELLRLLAWEGLTADELAVALGCTPNAARIRVHRARRRLAEALRAPSLNR